MVILTEYGRNDIENILSNYSIGKYNSHKHVPWALQNTLYFIRTTKGKYVLKIFENANKNFINYQLRITDYLSERRIPVAKAIKLRNGKELLDYNKKRIVMYRFIEGRPPKQYTKRLIKDIARKFSLMNKYLLKLNLKGDYGWPVNHQFKPNPDKVDFIGGINFKKVQETLIQELKTINKKKLRKSVIHSDFHDINLLTKNNKLNVILDWDDSHVDYLAYELAVIIMNLFELNTSKNMIQLFLNEYQKNIRLNDEEKKAIYYFVKQRFLGVIFWHSKQMKLHKDQKEKLKKDQKQQIQTYQKFAQISLQDFLELF